MIFSRIWGTSFPQNLNYNMYVVIKESTLRLRNLTLRLRISFHLNYNTHVVIKESDPAIKDLVS